MPTEPTLEQLLAYERAQTRLAKFQLERERNRHEREKREWQMEKVALHQQLAMAEAATNTYKQMFCFGHPMPSQPPTRPTVPLTVLQRLSRWWGASAIKNQ